MGLNLGAVADKILPFDPTPGFNLTKSTKGVPFIAHEAPEPVTKPAAKPASTGQVLGASTTNPSAVYTGAAAVNGTGAGNTADIAAYTDQINALNQLLGQADVSRNNGLNSINQSFTNNQARLNQQQSNTLSQYATQRQDTTNDFQKALQQINSNARNGYNSLQLLLGGTGSAGDVLAPFAVSQAANKQRGGSSDAYARNVRDIDTATTNAQSQYKNALDDLLGQKNSKLQSLISSIDAQKQNYLSQIASAQNQLSVAKGGNYQTPTATNNAIAALIAEQNGLASQYANPTYDVKDVQVSTPEMAAYQAEAARLAGGNNVEDGTDDTTTSLAALLKLNKDNLQTGYAY